MIVLHVRWEVVIASRAARSFGHWNDRASARPVPPRSNAPLPPPNTGRPAPASKRAAESRGPSGPQWDRAASTEDTRSRLQLLAQRREDGELMGELADSADSEPNTPSAATRNGLRALADLHRDQEPATRANTEQPDEHLWNRVLGLAAPMVTFVPKDPRAR